jgi:chromosome segregation ATPase
MDTDKELEMKVDLFLSDGTKLADVMIVRHGLPNLELTEDSAEALRVHEREESRRETIEHLEGQVKALDILCRRIYLADGSHETVPTIEAAIERRRRCARTLVEQEAEIGFLKDTIAAIQENRVGKSTYTRMREEIDHATRELDRARSDAKGAGEKLVAACADIAVLKAELVAAWADIAVLKAELDGLRSDTKSRQRGVLAEMARMPAPPPPPPPHRPPS